MAASVLVLSFVDLNYGIYFVCVASVAFCFGGNITIFPAIVGDFSGMKNHSKNYGIVYQGFGFGALAGSFIGAVLGGFHGIHLETAQIKEPATLQIQILDTQFRSFLLWFFIP